MICPACTEGYCQRCEGRPDAPCTCDRPFWPASFAHATCVGPNPYCAVREHLRNTNTPTRTELRGTTNL